MEMDGNWGWFESAGINRQDGDAKFVQNLCAKFGAVLFFDKFILKEAFIIYTIPIYTQSEKVRNRNYKKVYTVDWALANAVAFAGSIDITRQFENCIFIELLRRKHSICYYKTRKGYEIDFITVTSNKRENSKNLYQVCYDLGSKEVLKRETRGIAETMRYFNLNNAFIITMNNEDEIIIDGTADYP